VAQGFADVIARHGPDAVAFYVSGQLLTEDYYVANKLMKGFIGSANVDTNSRLCMASSVSGHRRAFGADVVPGTYEDLDTADLIVLVGSNAAWCHPILFQRIAANRRTRGAKVVVIDPRRTATAEEADLFLAIAPGMDSVLFCGLLVHLADTDHIDRDYIEARTSGFAAALNGARALAPNVVATAAATGIAPEKIAEFFALFAETACVVTAFSQGVNQSAQGTDKVNAIINCHLATGRIGRRGAGPFSLTGQPNAMGGREVGGLANQLAAHMGFAPAEIERARRFWNAPRMATREGLKAVAMFEAIGRREIKALWVMGTNPVVSLPNGSAVREACGQLDLFVVSDNVIATDTIDAGAHVLLPAAGWGEKDGTVTNSERRISRQRAFLPLPGEARPDWRIVCEVAQRFGFADAFSFSSAADIFREHAALSGFENDGTRAFDIGALAELSDEEYAALAPVQWPLPKTAPGRERFFADGSFFTPDHRAQFVSPVAPGPRAALTPKYPFRLNTGRIRDQWHTMTRTGLSARLARHCPEPFVAVHPDDARRLALADGGFARVRSRYGACVLKVVIDPGQRAGCLFVPIHWSQSTSSHASIGAVVMPDSDPFSGQPEAKATPAAIEGVSFAWRGFVLARDPVQLPAGTWWARVALAAGQGFVLATNETPQAWRLQSRQLFGTAAEFAEFVDDPQGIYRVAAFRDGRLVACLFVGPADCLPQWDAVAESLGAETLTATARRLLLSGRAATGLTETGPLVCTCFGVGLNAIRDAVASRAAANVEDIGKALKAGTNCGSCLPELKRVVQASLPAA